MLKAKAPPRLIAQNRKARHDYFIDEELGGDRLDWDRGEEFT